MGSTVGVGKNGRRQRDVGQAGQLLTGDVRDANHGNSGHLFNWHGCPWTVPSSELHSQQIFWPRPGSLPLGFPPSRLSPVQHS
jgi:hypothetical protein